MAAQRRMNREEATALLMGPFGKFMRDTVASYVAPIFWETLDNEDRVVLRNGTIFFLDAGEGVFAVTAGHVYDGYVRAKVRYPKSSCQLWKMSFDPEARLIARQSDHIDLPDLATFEITAEEVKGLGKTILTGHQASWPPLPPEQGKGVLFAGYPGCDRLEIAPDTIDFGIFPGFLVATSVSDRMILCLIEEDYLIDTPCHKGIAPSNYDAGGVSGAPLLTVVEHRGLWSWRLGGVIVEAPAAGGMLLAARADYILPNGQLKPYH
jgi:hypothetical protein